MATDQEPGGQRSEELANIRFLCFQIARDLRTALDRDLSPFGLTVQQAGVLLRCCWQSSLSPRQLAAAVSTDSAGISGLLDHLERNGLVKRRANPADRRAVFIEPTREGRALAPQLREVFQANQATLLQGFSEEEMAELEEMLQRLRANIGEYLLENA